MRGDVAICKHDNHRQMRDNGGVGTTALWSNRAKDCTMTTDIYLADLSPGQRLTASDLQAILLNCAGYICPHITTANLLVFRRMTQGLRKSGKYSGIEGEDILGKLNYYMPRALCGEPDCGTEFRVFKAWEEESLLLSVWRRHGGLRSIMDPVWLSHAEVDRDWARRHGAHALSLRTYGRTFLMKNGPCVSEILTRKFGNVKV
jgi:hypothetical protein